MRTSTGILALAAVAGVLGGKPAQATQTFGFLYDGTNYTQLDPFGATYAEALAVSGGNVVGNYSDGTAYYGFLYNGTNYTTIAPPGARFSTATGVSGNNIVGYYAVGTHGYAYLYDGSSSRRSFRQGREGQRRPVSPATMSSGIMRPLPAPGTASFTMGRVTRRSPLQALHTLK
jgi:hypothetical protein